MKGIGGPLLCIGDLLSDVGESNGGDSLENSSLLSASASSIPNSKDAVPAADLNQLFEHSWTLPNYKSHSHSLEHHDENKNSPPSSHTISASGEDVSMCNDEVDFDHNLEVVMDIGDGRAKKMDFKRALPDDETWHPSLSKVDRANCMENKGREDVEDMDVENCAPDPPTEGEVERYEGILPNELQSQTSQLTQASQSLSLEKDKDVIGGGLQHVRVDCSSHFITDKEFRTKEEVLHWAKLQGRQTGTVLMINKSQDAYRGRAPRLCLGCDRGGKYQSQRRQGLRKTGTKKCECPFKLGTTWSRVGEKEWKIKVYVKNGVHNHQLAKLTERHTYAGKLTKVELGIITDMAKAGAKPREIIHALQKNDPGNCTSLRQVYNTIRAIRSKGMDGQNHTQQLRKELNDNGSADSIHNLEFVMDIGDGGTMKLNSETTLPDDSIDSICCVSPLNVDRVISLEENREEDVENVDVENCVLDPPIEDEVMPPKEDQMREDKCVPPKPQSFSKGREDVENSDVENSVQDTTMEDEGVPNERQLLTTQALESLPLEKDEDVRLDCSSLFKTDKEFRAKEEVLNWAKILARQTGTVLMMSKSQEPHRGRAPRLYLGCERGGKYETHRRPPKGLRKTRTKKCACPFELGTTWTRVGENEWKIKVHVRNGIHNHPLGRSTEGHSSAGKLTKKEVDIVADLTKARVRPREIIQALRKNDPGNCTSLSQLYNAVHAIKMKGKLQAVERSIE